MINVINELQRYTAAQPELYFSNNWEYIKDESDATRVMYGGVIVGHWNDIKQDVIILRIYVTSPRGEACIDLHDDCMIFGYRNTSHDFDEERISYDNFQENFFQLSLVMDMKDFTEDDIARLIIISNQFHRHCDAVGRENVSAKIR
jgi:hypothetical protein